RAVGPRGAAQPVWPLEVAAQPERFAPCAFDRGTVVGMDGFEPARAALRGDVAAGVVLPRLVHIAASAMAIREPDERWKGVEQVRAPRGILEDAGNVPQNRIRSLHGTSCASTMRGPCVAGGI